MRGHLAGEGEGQRDAVERHPVDVLLPVRPLPPHVAVAGGTHVLVIPAMSYLKYVLLIIFIHREQMYSQQFKENKQ